MVFFHPHECSVLVGFGHTSAVISNGEQLVLALCPLRPQAVQLFIALLPFALALSDSVNKFCIGRKLLICQLSQLLPGQIAFSTVLVENSLCFFFQFCQILFDTCFPDKSIPVRHALDLCTVDEHFLVFCFFQFGKSLYKLVEQVFYCIFRLSAPESGKRRVVRHPLSLKKPDKVDILGACKLQLSGGINAAHIAVHQ